MTRQELKRRICIFHKITLEVQEKKEKHLDCDFLIVICFNCGAQSWMCCLCNLSKEASNDSSDQSIKKHLDNQSVNQLHPFTTKNDALSMYIQSVVQYVLADGKKNPFEAYQVICMVFRCEKHLETNCF